MNLSSVFDGREGSWNLALMASTSAALLLNLVGLVTGYTIVLPHLLYIPVVIGAYRFPRHGLTIAGTIGGAYFLMVLLLVGGDVQVLLETLVRVGVIVFIGWLISTISGRLREKEILYTGLFDHSEAGSILVREIDGRMVVEEVNWNAASLLGRSVAELKGVPVSTFIREKDEQLLFSRLAREGKVYAEEIVFSLPGGGSHHVLVSIASLPDGRAIMTGVDITRRIHAERALHAANQKLNLLSRISSDHLHRSVDEIIETVDHAMDRCENVQMANFLAKVRKSAWDLARQIFLTETYQDLGASPPCWIRVQDTLRNAMRSHDWKDVSVRIWAGRLEVYADPLFRDVLVHLIENAIRHGAGIRTIIVSHHEAGEVLELIIEDDGKGIPAVKKEAIFEYDAGQHAGLGLFICRQILSVTNLLIAENGTEGRGARFVIRVPAGGWRIEGSREDAPPFPLQGPGGLPEITGNGVRELLSAEFPVANELWTDYHETKGDPRTDRIFAAFEGGNAVSLARCRRHPDGHEVDAVFTPVRHRGHGYANQTVQGLLEACGHDTLYMHSVLNLTGFYGRYGFVPIPESGLPRTIRERFSWANGEMEGANVCPMRRDPQ